MCNAITAENGARPKPPRLAPEVMAAYQLLIEVGRKRIAARAGNTDDSKAEVDRFGGQGEDKTA